MIDLGVFVEEMTKRGFFPEERNRVVVACSGGPDSLFLLYLLWSCREPLRLDLSVLTCDHGLRASAKHEVLDVQQRAWSLGLPCAVRELDVPTNAQPGESIEMAARRLRRDAYAEVADAFGASSVALGHHLDDQAETILLRLSRGTGMRGAGGIKERAPLNEKVELLRPLLGYRRWDIEETLDVWGIEAFLDPSNASRDHVRNMMRLDVVPALEELNPGVVEHLGAFARELQEVEDWLSTEATERGKTCFEGNALHLEPWRFLPEVLQQRVLFGWFRKRGGNPEEVTRATWLALRSALQISTTTSRRWLLGGVTLVAEQDVLTAGLPTPDDPQIIPVDATTLQCAALGRELYVEPTVELDFRLANQHSLDGPLTAYIQMPDTGFELRTVQPGERYRQFGMKGSAKVSDLMINAKIPARLRPVWPVVASGDDIVWIPGFRVADAWQVTKFPCLRCTLEAGETHTLCG